MTSYVSLADIAERVGVEVSTVRRAIKRAGDNLGIALERRKTVKGGWAHCLSTGHAEKLVTYLEAQKKPTFEKKEDDLSFQKLGYFYVIQLVPEALPNRVKIGYADNVEQRLAEHRTAAPTAKLVKSWRCKRAWDQAAMDSITRENCKLVQNEVYEGNVDEFVKRADDFFSLMSSGTDEIPLSEYSPLLKERG